MKILLILSVILVLVLFAMILYSNILAKKSVLYYIGKGKHYSVRPLFDWIKIPLKLGIAKENFTFTAIFGSGTNYSNWRQDKSVHKLYGINYGLFPHRNSIRIGWRYGGQFQIEIFSYVYRNGIRKEDYLCHVSMNEEIKFKFERIGREEIYISILVGDWKPYSPVETVIQMPEVSKIKLKLWPYYGGVNPASEPVNIFIKES